MANGSESEEYVAEDRPALLSGTGTPPLRNIVMSATYLQHRAWVTSPGRCAAYPRIGRKPVHAIDAADLMAVLEPLWIAKHETARRLRLRIGQVMKWAIGQGHRADNPAGDAVGAALPKVEARPVHQRALPHAEVGAALAAVRRTGAAPAAKLAFEFMVLTAVRSGEARHAAWDEIDLDRAVWTIPAARMKAGREHRVPLAPRALEVLDEAATLRRGALVFRGRRRPASVTAADRDERRACVPRRREEEAGRKRSGGWRPGGRRRRSPPTPPRSKRHGPADHRESHQTVHRHQRPPRRPRGRSPPRGRARHRPVRGRHRRNAAMARRPRVNPAAARVCEPARREPVLELGDGAVHRRLRGAELLDSGGAEAPRSGDALEDAREPQPRGIGSKEESTEISKQG